MQNSNQPITNALKKVYALLDMPSGAGIGLIVFNVIAMMWFDVWKHGLGMQEVAMVGAIFAAKTTHGIMTKGNDDDKN